MNAKRAMMATESVADYEQLALSTEERAAKMHEHWQSFKNGSEDEFYRYFMLEVHENERQLFLESMNASTEIPYPNWEQQAVLKSGRAILWATTQGYDNGDPYAVEYRGERIFPIE